MKRFLILLFLVPFALSGQNLKDKINTDIRGKIYDPSKASNMHQAIVDGMIAVTATGTNAYTATVNAAITSYQTGYQQLVKFTNANTTASTINFNALGVKSLVKDGAGTALASGDLKANTTYLLSYDGTNFQVLNIPGSGGGGGISGLTSGRVTFATSATTIGDDSNLVWDNTNKALSVGGGGAIGSSVSLDIQGTTKAFKMGTATRASIVTGVNGMLTADTNLPYFHNGTSWREVVMKDATNDLTVNSDIVNLTGTNVQLILSGTSSQVRSQSFRGSNTSVSLSIIGSNDAATNGIVMTSNGNYDHTSGLKNSLLITTTFAPASGTGTFNLVRKAPTINQTGSANGDVSMLAINPTYTAAGGNVYGIDYNPTVTSIAGNHLAFRATSGDFVMGGATIATSGIFGWNNTTKEIKFNGARLWTDTNTNSKDNIFLGVGAGNLSVSGIDNFAAGPGALKDITTGSNNIAIGHQPLADLTTGSGNVGIGQWAGLSATGSTNIFIGQQAALNYVSGSSSIFIGSLIDAQSTTASGQLSIQNAIFGTGNTGTGTAISSGNIGMYIVSPTARLHLPATTATASTASLKIPSGTLLTTPEAGAIEANATALYWTNNAGTRIDLSAGGSPYYAPSTLVTNATDANFTATLNGVHNILDGVASTNRVITIPTGSNGDVMKFYNTEDTRVWSFTGATVYLADRVTVVTELLYNVPCHMERIDGRWIITN